MRATVLAAAVLLATAATARADAGSYTRCPTPTGATLLQQSRTTCDAVTPVAQALLAAPRDQAPEILTQQGWTAISAVPAASGFDLTARHGTAILRVRRPGSTPDIDGWSAGRELLFSRAKLKSGGVVTGAAALCTSSWLIHYAGRTAGLTAGHCSGLLPNGTADLRNADLRRRPQPGIILGRVIRQLQRHVTLDALVLPVPSGPRRPASPVVYRGPRRPPWIIAGSAQLTAGREICFTGRTSGRDQCGRLVGKRARPVERLLAQQYHVRVRCTTVIAREGDSGGPVYTAPRADGTVRALGIVDLVLGITHSMCFTPLSSVLSDLHATLITGS